MIRVYFKNGEVRTVTAVEGQRLIKMGLASYTPYAAEDIIVDDEPQLEVKVETKSKAEIKPKAEAKSKESYKPYSKSEKKESVPDTDDDVKPELVVSTHKD